VQFSLAEPDLGPAFADGAVVEDEEVEKVEEGEVVLDVGVRV